LRRTLAGKSSAETRPTANFSERNHTQVKARFKRFLREISHAEKFFRQRVTNRVAGSLSCGGISRFQTSFQRDDQQMTISTRIALGISAAALSLSLALAPAAFAQDKMGKDDGMKKDTMSKDTMKKDTMSKDAMKKDDGMKKDGMMKKDDGMKK
jgi:pentapeptide MXKDX repeat protein